MKLRILLNILLTVIISRHYSVAQAVYLFDYNFHSKPDTTSYSCLYFSNDDGTGLLKLKYNDAGSGKPVVKELFVEDSYIINPDETGTLKLLAVKTAFKDAANQEPIKVAAPVFIFRENPSNGFFEPVGVSADQNSYTITTETYFFSRRFDKGGPSKEFALAYFDRKDPFYNSFFSGTRGGIILNPLEQRDLKLHLILVADTLDKSIGKSAAKDMRKMQEAFTQFSELIGIKKQNFRQQLIAGKQCESRNVLKALSKLQPGRNDIIVFYYSGHGFRTNQTDTFPYIKCTNINSDSATIVKNSLRIRDIFDSIVSKKARMNLVLSDCCNNDIGRPKDTGRTVPKVRGEWELSEKNTRELFLNSRRISILATAAQNGEKAILDPEYSSYMSHAFIAAMRQYTGKLEYKVSWPKLLDATGRTTGGLARKVCCSKPCCGPSCTTGKPVPCVQTSVYIIKDGK
jgi:hypothetical protein